MRFGESNGAFELTNGMEETGGNAKTRRSGPTLGSRILRRQQTGTTRLSSEYLQWVGDRLVRVSGRRADSAQACEQDGKQRSSGPAAGEMEP
jgi:hypothetical protein